MSLSDQIRSGMLKLQQYHKTADGVAVVTDCLYPSNGVVQVIVRGAGDKYIVSDEGGALREASAAGADLDRSASRFSRAVKMQGLQLDHGVIRSPFVSLETVPVAIVLVANASKELADHVFETWRLPKARNFKQLVKLLLRSEFSGDKIKEDVLLGNSNKPHAFDNVILLPGGRTLVVDPVMKDPNSINSRVVANLDVQAANHPGIIQRLVYDDEDHWRADDLSILQVSKVPVIAYSKSAVALRQLREAA